MDPVFSAPAAAKNDAASSHPALVFYIGVHPSHENIVHLVEEAEIRGRPNELTDLIYQPSSDHEEAEQEDETEMERRVREFIARKAQAVAKSSEPNMPTESKSGAPTAEKVPPSMHTSAELKAADSREVGFVARARPNEPNVLSRRVSARVIQESEKLWDERKRRDDDSARESDTAPN